LLIGELHCYVFVFLKSFFYALIEFNDMMMKVLVGYMSSMGIKFNYGSSKYL